MQIIITVVKNFFITFSILLVSQILTLLVAAAQYANSDPGFIQLGFALFSAILLVYSLLFVLIDLIKPSSKKYIIIFNSALSFLLAFMGVSRYISNLRFESSILIIIGIFFMIHFFVIIYRKSKETY